MIGTIEYHRDKKEGFYGYVVSHFDEHGKLVIEKLNVGKGKFKNYVVTDYKEEADAVSWDEQFLREVYGDRQGKFEMLDFFEELPDHVKKRIYAPSNKPIVIACDIETKFDDEFPLPEKADQEIVSFAFTTPKLHTLVVGEKHLDEHQCNNITRRINEHFRKEGLEANYTFKYVQVEDEVERIKRAGKIMKSIPLLTGWNFERFDWVYISKRAENLNLDVGKTFSPVGRSKTDRLKNLGGKVICEYEKPMHSQIHDYMRVFAKYDYTVSPKMSNKLDWVAKEVLGVQKIKFQGDLMELYHQDYETYVFYNAVDTILVQLIHQKKQTLDSLLSSMGTIKMPIDDMYGTIAPAEKLMHEYFYSKGLRVHSKYDKIDEYEYERDKEIFEGGKVLDPQPRRYYPRNPIDGLNASILSKDFAGLYPSIMESFNISPEAWVERFYERDDLIPDSPEHNIKVYQRAYQRALEEYGDDPNYIVSLRGVVYLNKDDNALRTIQKNLSASRNAFKALAFYTTSTIGRLNEEINNRRSNVA